MEPLEHSNVTTNPDSNAPLTSVDAAQRHTGVATEPMDHEFMDDESVLGRCSIGLDNGNEN